MEEHFSTARWDLCSASFTMGNLNFCGMPQCWRATLCRMFSLNFLRISIHDEVKKQLQLKTQEGRSYYLELCFHPDEQEDLFALWVKVINQRLAGVPMPFFHRDCRLRNDSCFEHSPGRGLFNLEMGPLQHQFHHGEVDLLRNAPMLESNFVQVNRRGEIFDIHNSVEIVTLAIAACTNLMPNRFPNMLVVARSIVPSRENLPQFENLICQSPPPRTFELTRLLPLCFLRISVHNEEKKQLRFKQPTGRAWYLELCSHPVNQEDLFELWVKVINLLYPPSKQPSETTPLDSIRDTGEPEEAWGAQIPSHVDLPDTEAVHTVHPLYRGTSPRENHARSMQSPTLSFYSTSEVLRSRDSDASSIQSPSPLARSHHSTEDPSFSPIIIQEDTVEPGNSSLLNDVESEESLERSLSCKELHPEEQVEAESDLPPNRTTTKGRSKTPHRASPWKASKILSLFRCCSCERQKKSRQESKGRSKRRNPK